MSGWPSRDGGALRGRLDSLRRLLRSREGGDPAAGSEPDRDDDPDRDLTLARPANCRANRATVDAGAGLDGRAGPG